LILVGLAMIIVAVLTGASLLNLILRTSAAMLATGSLVALIYHHVSSGMLQASLVEQEGTRKEQTDELDVPEHRVAVGTSGSVKG
jgi:hypothetical protein